MIYYDIHTHERAVQSNVYAIASIDIREPFPPQEGMAYAAGIHPWHANEELLPALKELAANPQVVAIGEAGLDKLCETDWAMQKEIFEAQIDLSEESRKPMIIHCVKAWGELLAIRKRIRPAMPWIIHGFRGKAALAEQLLKAGMYLSFGQLYNAEALAAAWEARRLLTETDGKGICIREVYKKIASDLGICETELQKETKDMLDRLSLIMNIK